MTSMVLSLHPDMIGVFTDMSSRLLPIDEYGVGPRPDSGNPVTEQINHAYVHRRTYLTTLVVETKG